MNVLFDVNVILDSLLDRTPRAEEATLLMDAVEGSVINGFLSADSVTTLFYLIRKVKNKQQANQNIKLLLELFEIAPVNRTVLQEAVDAKFNDYEDAVVYRSALHSNCDAVVTGNVKDFKKAKIAVFTPRELLKAIHYSG